MPPASSTRVRFGVAVMLFVTVAINYLDRSNLSVAATGLSRELRLDPVRLGIVFSGFGWAYAFFQIPAGWLVDRIGARTLYAAACGLWSLATLIQGFAGGFLALLGCRLLLGLFEAPAFPMCNRLVTEWFPENERAGAIGFYTSGEFVGLAFLTPALVLAQAKYGWRTVFFGTGALGLAWAGWWYFRYRDPAGSRRLSDAEREHIKAGGGWVEGKADPLAFDLRDLRIVLSQRKLWGMYLGQFALNTIPWFFLTWFPTYLVTYRHFNFIRAGYFASLPFMAAFLGVLAGGACSDFLVRRGASATFARKAPIIAGMLLSAGVVGANFVSRPGWVIFFLTAAFFANGFASITWILVSLVAPKRLLGLTGGVFNFFGNLAAVLVPLLIGVIVRFGGFAPALAFVSAIALGGAASYIFLVGRVERIAEPRVVVLIGVAGSGKTTVGRELARELGWEFRDGDEFHPAANVAKMAAGIPLDDADREPWLAAIRAYVDGRLAAGGGAVVACSALKEAYRRRIVPDPSRVSLVWLTGNPEVIRERLRSRKGHFMKEDMLASQLETLEPPADALPVDVGPPPVEIAGRIRAALGV